MKKLILLTGLGVLLLSFTALQSDTDQIISAFKAADAAQVGNYLDDYVDVKLLDKDEVKNVGHNQAMITLKSFFSENGVKGFEKSSERELGNTMYITGKLLNSAKGYNITILMKLKEAKHKIISIRIS